MEVQISRTLFLENLKGCLPVGKVPYGVELLIFSSSRPDPESFYYVQTVLQEYTMIDDETLYFKATRYTDDCPSKIEHWSYGKSIEEYGDTWFCKLLI